MSAVKGLLVLLLVLLVRKLCWCLRWLWCYSHGRPVPPPISWLPRRSGALFRAHMGQDGEEE